MSREARKRPDTSARRHRLGFTLVEVVLAFAVLLVAGVWLLGSYRYALTLSEVSEQTTEAISDLKGMMERISNTPFNSLATDFPSGAVNGVVGGTAEKYGGIIGGYSLPSEQVVVTHLPTTTADPRELTVQVRWTSGGRSYQKSFSTMRTSRS